MPVHQTTDRDRVVITKYLLEAHGKERQLETALRAQIAMAKSPVVERSLSDHLKVTQGQIHALELRIDELGVESDVPGVGVIDGTLELVSTVANKGLALAKGPLQLLRGTSPADQELRNLRDCYWNEAEEIAHYRVIETVAKQLGDTETAALAASHRADEEAMQRTLEGLLPGVVRHVVETEASPGPAEAAERAAATATGTGAARKQRAKAAA